VATRSPAAILDELVATTEPAARETLADELAALGADVVPFLAKLVDERSHRVHPLVFDQDAATRAVWAIRVLATLGPAAADAFDAIEHVAHENEYAWVAMYRIDPQRVRVQGVHERPIARQYIVDDLLARGEHDAAMRLLGELLESPDDGVVKFALGLPDRGLPERVMPKFALYMPDLVPVDLIRARALDPDHEVRELARDVLIALHIPDDAIDVLARCIDDGALPDAAVPWLAPLPASERALDVVDVVAAREIMMRRRCAGLSTTSDAPRRLATTILDGSSAGRRETTAAAWIATELGMTDLVMPRRHRTIAEKTWWSMLAGLRTPYTDDDDEYRQHVQSRVDTVTATSLIATGDEHFYFYNGGIDDPWSPEGGAYQAYATALLLDPRSAYAALQLAWIDRGFGTPITADRIAWLADLGVVDRTLLDELAIPVTPAPGERHATPKGVGALADGLARRATSAGLPSIARRFFLQDPALAGHVEPTNAAIRAHLARARAACRLTDGSSGSPSRRA
jgi:hypothetical protein